MSLLTRKPPTPVSADAVAAVIGGTGDQLAERYGVVALDFMSRPMLSYEHARQAFEAAERYSNDEIMVRVEYERMQEARIQSRREAIEAATARVRAEYTADHRGGQEHFAWMQRQWQAGREAEAAWNAENGAEAPTISEFRRSRTT
jgi:hypothetical protein